MADRTFELIEGGLDSSINTLDFRRSGAMSGGYSVVPAPDYSIGAFTTTDGPGNYTIKKQETSTGVRNAMIGEVLNSLQCQIAALSESVTTLHDHGLARIASMQQNIDFLMGGSLTHLDPTSVANAVPKQTLNVIKAGKSAVYNQAAVLVEMDSNTFENNKALDPQGRNAVTTRTQLAGPFGPSSVGGYQWRLIKGVSDYTAFSGVDVSADEYYVSSNDSRVAANQPCCSGRTTMWVYWSDTPIFSTSWQVTTMQIDGNGAPATVTITANKSAKSDDANHLVVVPPNPLGVTNSAKLISTSLESYGLITMKCSNGMLTSKAQKLAFSGGGAMYTLLNSTSNTLYYTALWIYHDPKRVEKPASQQFGGLNASVYFATTSNYVNAAHLPATALPEQAGQNATLLEDKKGASKFYKTYSRVSKIGYKFLDVLQAGSHVVATIAGISAFFPPLTELAIPTIEAASLVSRTAEVGKLGISTVDKVVELQEDQGFFRDGDLSKLPKRLSSAIEEVGLPLMWNLAPKIKDIGKDVQFFASIYL